MSGVKVGCREPRFCIGDMLLGGVFEAFEIGDVLNECECRGGELLLG